MQKLIIGFCGPMGGGKSTAAKAVIEHFNNETDKRATLIPLAAPLKNMLAALGVPLAHLYGTPEQKAEPLEIFNGKSAREAMQTLGTEWGRECIGPSFWVNAWKSRVEQSDASVIVVDDLRFQNEAEAIRDLGGFVVLIRRPVVEAKAGHASEQWRLIEPDYAFFNDASEGRVKQRILLRVASMRGRLKAREKETA